MKFQDQYVYYIYHLLKSYTSHVDAIYEDHVIDLIGVHGLIALKNYDLLEPCGSIDNRTLVTLLEPTDSAFVDMKDYDELLEYNKKLSKLLSKGFSELLKNI